MVWTCRLCQGGHPWLADGRRRASVATLNKGSHIETERVHRWSVWQLDAPRNMVKKLSRSGSLHSFWIIFLGASGCYPRWPWEVHGLHLGAHSQSCLRQNFQADQDKTTHSSLRCHVHRRLLWMRHCLSRLARSWQTSRSRAASQWPPPDYSSEYVTAYRGGVGRSPRLLGRLQRP